MRKNTRNIAITAISITALLYLFIPGDFFSSSISIVKNTKIFIWLTSIPFSIAIFLLLGVQLKVSLHPFLGNLKTTTAFHLSASNTMLNYLPAKAGLIARGLYLKRNEGITLQRYTEATIFTSLISLITALLLFILSIAYNQNLKDLTIKKITELGPQETQSISLIAVLILTLVISIFFFKKKTITKKTFPEFSTKTALAIFLTSLTLFIVSSARLYLCFFSLNYHLNLNEIIFLHSVTSLSFMLSIAPGNIGIKESALVIAAACILIDPKLALIAGLLDRLSALVPTFLIGPISSAHLLNRIIEKKGT